MIYLILAIVSSAMISVLMRASEKHAEGGVSMLAANYLMCCLLSLIFTGSVELFPASPDLPRALFLGVINGILFLTSFVLLQWNISKNGVVLPATFMKLGVLVPTLLSILVFREMPRVTQVLGIVLAVASILMIQGKDKQQARSTSGLVCLLLAGGSADAMSKVYEELGPAPLKDHFLLYTFIIAMILCIFLCVVKKQPITLRNFLWGLAIGIPNYLSTRFLLLSLDQVPAVVAYPTFSVGVIVLAAATSLLVFHEKPNRRTLVGLGVIMASLALLNI